MTRLFAFVCNDPDRVRCLLHPARRQLVGEAKNADGWGIGFYQSGEVLLQRRPKRPTEDVDFYKIVSDLRTDVLVGHVRHATVGAVKNENAHPFRFRSWLFAHHGTVPGWASVAERVTAETPDFLRRNIRGQTDSEHVFHLLLGFLHEGNRIDDPTTSTAHVAQALGRTASVLERIAPGSASDLDLVVTNGRVLVGLRRGKPMYVQRTSGVRDCPVCREAEVTGRPTKRIDHEHLRGATLVCDVESPLAAPWEEVPDGHVIAVHHDLRVDFAPLPTT